MDESEFVLHGTRVRITRVEGGTKIKIFSDDKEKCDQIYQYLFAEGFVTTEEPPTIKRKKQ